MAKKRNVSSWLANLLGPIDFFLNGVAESVTRREAWNFIGTITIADDPDNERTNITFGGGGGPAGVPITDAAIHGSARTLTLVDHFDDVPDAADGCVIGGDRTFDPAKCVDLLLLVANTEIQWSITGGVATANLIADGMHVVNGKYFGFLSGVDQTTLPTTGLIRLPYNGGSAVDVLAVKDNAAANRVFITYGPGNRWDIGNSAQAAHLIGSLLEVDTGIRFNYGQRVKLVEKDADYTLVEGVDFHVAAVAGVATITLPGSGTTGDSYEVSNISGGAIDVDGNGTTIYGYGATESVPDGETRLYRYNAGALSGSAKWVHA